MTAATVPAGVPVAKKGIHWRRVALHVFLIAISIVWLFPLAWALYTSLRPYADTAAHGYVSFTGVLNLDNFFTAWNNAELPRYFGNTIVIVVPAVILTLFLASMAAFTLARFSWRFNLVVLMLFTAGNLLPPQVIITPLFRMYLALPFPNHPRKRLGAMPGSSRSRTSSRRPFGCSPFSATASSGAANACASAPMELSNR